MRLLSTLFLCFFIIFSTKAELKKQITKAFANLKKDHPRLIISQNRIIEYKTLLKNDATFASYFKLLQKKADKIINEPLLEYKIPDGIRLLRVSRAAFSRIYNLGLAYHISGKEKYAKRAKRELLNVCSFKDWNPKHFLDTAEMTNAVGIGYDWFYSYLSKNNKKIIRQAIIAKGLTPEAGFAIRRTNNWNVVCNAGRAIGALAIADTNPELASKVIYNAVKFMPKCLAFFAPDGGWFEGPGYWQYTARYFALGISAMQAL